MSSTEDVLRTDPAMRIAREIADQAGVNPERVKEWYEDVVLGEMPIGHFFLLIEKEVESPSLLETLRTLRRQLPYVDVEETIS